MTFMEYLVFVDAIMDAILSVLYFCVSAMDIITGAGTRVLELRGILLETISVNMRDMAGLVDSIVIVYGLHLCILFIFILVIYIYISYNVYI
jgi:hypothetical protein